MIINQSCLEIILVQICAIALLRAETETPDNKDIKSGDVLVLSNMREFITTDKTRGY